MTTILTVYFVSIPVWMLLIYTWETLVSLGKEGVLKLMYSIGEKTVFSAIAIASKGVYDVVRGLEHQDHLLILLSLPILAFGIYLVSLSKSKGV